MLVEQLVKGGKYSVIERKALDKILSEQNFSNSDRANPATAAKIGQILGVDAIIMGSITKFGRDDKSKAIGGGGFAPRGFGLGGIKRNEAKAVSAPSAPVWSIPPPERYWPRSPARAKASVPAPR